MQELSFDNKNLKQFKDNVMARGGEDNSSELKEEIEKLRNESRQLKHRLKTEEQSKLHWQELA